MLHRRYLAGFLCQGAIDEMQTQFASVLEILLIAVGKIAHDFRAWYLPGSGCQTVETYLYK